MRPSARPDAPFELGRAMADQVFSAFAACSVDKLDEKSVHSCRVHLKRARALARAGRDAAPGLYGVFNDSAREIMQSLSHARDLSALAQTARSLAETSSPKTSAALLLCAAALDEERQALAPLRAADIRSALRALLSLAQVWPKTTLAHTRRGAERMARRARCAYRDGARAHQAELRHTWRKREKDRLYIVDLLQEQWPKHLPKRRRSSSALSNCLGKEREILLLIEKITTLPDIAGGADGAARALQACAKRERGLQRQACKLGARVHRKEA